MSATASMPGSPSADARKASSAAPAAVAQHKPGQGQAVHPRLKPLPAIRVGAATDIGEKSENQDASVYVTGVAGLANLAVAAVFDGHGSSGRICALYVRSRLPHIVGELIDQAIRPSFKQSGPSPDDDDESSSQDTTWNADLESQSVGSAAASNAGEAGSQSPEDADSESKDNMMEVDSGDVENAVRDANIVAVNAERIITKAFRILHRAMAEDLGRHAARAGSTATVCLIWGTEVTTAWVGDSAALVSERLSADHWYSQAIVTQAHRLDNAEEAQRITSRGGIVAPSFEGGQQRIWVPKQRWAELNMTARGPGLNITRTLGDTNGHAVGVSSTPMVSSCDIGAVVQGFLTIASDGVWDVMGHKEAGDCIAETLEREGTQAAAEALVSRSLQRWLSDSQRRADNITVLLLHIG